MHSLFESSIEYTKTITKLIFNQIASVGKKYDLTRMESHALLFISIRGGSSTASDFIKCGSYSKSNVSTSFDKLSKKGYLEMKSMENDRRFQVVSLTKEGLAIGAEIGDIIHPIMKKLKEGITDEETAVILSVGAKVKINIDSIIEESNK